jgi:hypothetical protein
MNGFYIEQIEQMDVPENGIAVYEWKLAGATGKAAGEIRVVGHYAEGTGGKPGTEYWYITHTELDSKAATTGPARRFTIGLREIAAPRKDFITGPANLRQLVVPAAKALEAADIPSWVVSCKTPLLADGGESGLAAVRFEVTADPGAQQPPTWFWSPGELPNLFGKGKLDEIHESGRLLEMTAVEPSSPDFPKVQSTRGWRVAKP